MTGSVVLNALVREAYQSCVALSVRIECAEARRQPAYIEMQLRRERPFQRIANLEVDVDQLFRRSKLRFPLAVPDARITQEPIEHQEVALQIRFVQLGRLQLVLRSAVIDGNAFQPVLPGPFTSFQ